MKQPPNFRKINEFSCLNCKNKTTRNTYESDGITIDEVLPDCSKFDIPALDRMNFEIEEGDFICDEWGHE